MRLAILLGSLAASNLILTFLIQWYIVTSLGAGFACDAFFAGMAVPQLLLTLVSGPLFSVIVPILSNCPQNKIRQENWNFFLLSSFLCGAISIILAATAHWWIRVIMPGFTAQQADICTDLTRLQLLAIFFSTQAVVLTSTYHARSRFIWAESAPVIGATAAFGFVVWGLPRWSIYAAAWAMVIKGVIYVFLLLPGLGPFTRPDFKSQSIRQAWRRLKPLLIGTCYFKTDIIVDRLFASLAPAGGITLLHLSQQIYNSSATVLGKALVQPIFPALSQWAHQNKWSDFHRLITKRLVVVSAIVFGSFILLLGAGRPILSFIFENREFTGENVHTLWLLLITMIGLPVGASLGQILSSGFYAQGDTTTPTRITMITFTLSLGLRALLFHWWGILGLAGGATLYYLITLALCFCFLFQKLNRFMSR